MSDPIEIDASSPGPGSDGFQSLENDDLNGLFDSKASAQTPEAPQEEASPEDAGKEDPAAEAQVFESQASDEPADAPVEEAPETAGDGKRPQDPPAASRESCHAGMLREIDAHQTRPQKGRIKKSWMALAAAGAALLVFLAAGGIWLHHRQPRMKSETARIKLPAFRPWDEAVRPDEAAAEAAPEAVEERLRRIESLRRRLADKRTEIRRLRNVYHYGILEIEEELMGCIKRAGGEGFSPADGLKDKRVELLLRSIQRRQAYIEGLEKPLRWIDRAEEELIFLGRRAQFDLSVRTVAKGLDLDDQVRRMDSALERCEPTPEALAMPSEDSWSRQPLDPLWKRMLEKSRTPAAAASPNSAGNEAVAEEVCAGDLGRLSELSRLSLKGARCLADSNAKVLVLNRLNDISPAALGRLCEWPGDWLCLNGLDRLSPELAQRLFTWPGAWLSLNGITELTADTAKWIAGWKGRQLELMGLRKANGLDYLIQYEAGGGRLFVPSAVRDEIRNRSRSSGETAPGRLGRPGKGKSDAMPPASR